MAEVENSHLLDPYLPIGVIYSPSSHPSTAVVDSRSFAQYPFPTLIHHQQATTADFSSNGSGSGGSGSGGSQHQPKPILNNNNSIQHNNTHIGQKKRKTSRTGFIKELPIIEEPSYKQFQNQYYTDIKLQNLQQIHPQLNLVKLQEEDKHNLQPLLFLQHQQQHQHLQKQRWMEDKQHHSSSSSPHVFFNDEVKPNNSNNSNNNNINNNNNNNSKNIEDNFNQQTKKLQLLQQQQQQHQQQQQSILSTPTPTSFAFISPPTLSNNNSNSSKKKSIPVQPTYNAFPYIQSITNTNNNGNNSNTLKPNTQLLSQQMNIPQQQQIHKPIANKPALNKKNSNSTALHTPIATATGSSLGSLAPRPYSFITISDKLNAFKPITKEFPPTSYSSSSFPLLHFATPTSPTFTANRPHYSLSPFIPIEKDTVFPCTTNTNTTINNNAQSQQSNTTANNHNNSNSNNINNNVIYNNSNSNNGNTQHQNIQKQFEHIKHTHHHHTNNIANNNTINITNNQNNILQKKKKKSQGYCECCNTEFENLKTHLESKEHRSFAEKDKNYSKIDSIIMNIS